MLGVGGIIRFIAGVPVACDDWSGWILVLMALFWIGASVLRDGGVRAAVAARVLRTLGDVQAQEPPETG